MDGKRGDVVKIIESSVCCSHLMPQFIDMIFEAEQAAVIIRIYRKPKQIQDSTKRYGKQK